MKKLFTSLLLLLGGVIAAQAATEYDLWVGGQIVTSSNKSNIKSSTITSGTASYDPNTTTLTLKNTTIKNTTYCIQSNIEGLKIVIDGSVSMTTTGNSSTVFLEKTTTFKGKDFNATLSIYNQSQYSNGYYPAVWAVGGKDLTFESLWTLISSTYSALDGRSNSGLYSTLNLKTCNLSLSETESDTNFSCIYGFSAVKTWGVTYDYNGYKYDTSKRALVNSSGSIVTSHRLRGRMTIGRYIFNPKEPITLNSSSVGSGITSGSVTWNADSKELQLTNAVLKPASSYSAISYYPLNDTGDVSIWLSGASSITTAQGGYGIYAYNRDLTIDGQSVAAGAKLTINAPDWYGIYMGGKKLTLDGVALDITASYHGIYGGNTGTLDITKCKITSRSTSSDTQYGAIGGFAAVTLTDVDVATAYSCYRPSLKGFGSGSTLHKTVQIDIPTTYYGVYVLGHHITNVNPTKFGIEGYTSTNRGIQLDVANKKLIIEDATLTSSTDNAYAIQINKSNVVNTIELAGSNSFSVNGNCFWITGNANDVTMTTTAEQSSGKDSKFISTGKSAVYTAKNVTIDAAQRITFQGGSSYYAFSGYSGTPTLTIKQKSYNNSYVNLKAGSGCLSGMALKLDRMDFFYNGGSNQTPGCYYDSSVKQIKQNGNTVVKNQNVQITGYSTTYDLSVGGTQVNEVNAGAIGSPYITSGPTSVSYKNSSKTLTLNNATIDTKDSNAQGIRNAYPGINGLTINVLGTNKIAESTTNYGLYLGTTTTLTGSGSLEVGNGHNFNGVITFDNVNIKYLSNLVASSESPATLQVNLTTAGKKVEVDRYVYGWTNVNLQNGTKITKPEGGYYDNSKKFVVTAGGTNAFGVVFADKTATAIDAVEVEQNTDVKTIFDASGRQTETARPGLNIIRMSDGTVRKVMVK